MIRLAVSVLLFVIVLAGGSVAQVLESRAYGMRFAPGQSAMNLSNAITGAETVVYRVNARSGQIMNAVLTGLGSSVYFVVYGPGQFPGGRSITSSDKIGPLVKSRNTFEARLSANCDYRIEVRQSSSAAGRGERASFSLSISVTDGTIRPPSGGASGVGPGITSQYLRVTGVGSGDRLNVRGGPSTGFEVRYALRNGDIVRNLGCTPQVGGMMWCQVHRISDPNGKGWAAARYLEPSPAPGGSGATQLPGDALVPGTSYNATGILGCTIVGRANDCRFGVMRRGGGTATLDITLPTGTLRRIEFTSGRPTSSNSPAGIFGEWVGRDVIVSVGTQERYAVPEAILFGG